MSESALLSPEEKPRLIGHELLDFHFYVLHRFDKPGKKEAAMMMFKSGIFYYLNPKVAAVVLRTVFCKQRFVPSRWKRILAFLFPVKFFGYSTFNYCYFGSQFDVAIKQLISENDWEKAPLVVLWLDCKDDDETICNCIPVSFKAKPLLRVSPEVVH